MSQQPEEPLFGCGQEVVKKAVIVEEKSTYLAISTKLADFISFQPGSIFKGSNGYTIKISSSNTTYFATAKKICLLRHAWAGKKVRLEDCGKAFLLTLYQEITQVLIEAARACKNYKPEFPVDIFKNLETF